MRYNNATRPEDRLHDEGGDGVGTLKRDFILEIGSDPSGYLCAIGQAPGVAIVRRRGQMDNAGQQRFIGSAKVGVAVYRGTSHMGSVISLFQSDVFYPLGVAFDLVILTRQPQGCFHRVRPA